MSRCLVCNTTADLTVVGGETCCESCLRALVEKTTAMLAEFMEGEPNG